MFQLGSLLRYFCSAEYQCVPDRARSTLANFDFGQLFFFRVRPISTSANFDFGHFGQFLDVEFLDHKGWGPKGWGPCGGPRISRFFFPSPATVFILFSLSCWSFRGILVVFLKRRGAQMCTFGVLGLSGLGFRVLGSGQMVFGDKNRTRTKRK